MDKAQTLKEIELLQEIQKRNPPNSAEWRHASRRLQPLFAEMATHHNG